MDTIAQLGKFLESPAGGSLLKVGELGLSGAGLVGNILNEKQRSDQLSALTKQEKNLPDPTALAKQVALATQPLNTGLVQGVENSVQGSLASQGLAEAPGIQAAVLSQALAPYQQQNQSTALQLVMQRLGLPLQYAQTILGGLPPNTNLAPLLALLQKGSGTSAPSGSAPNLMTLLNLGQQTPTSGITSGSPSGDYGWLGTGDSTTVDPGSIDINGFISV